eukprot:c19413_g1_i2 orf=98-376(+)
MASLILQERLLGLSLGAVLGFGVVAYHHKLLWQSTAQLGETLSREKTPHRPLGKVPEPLFGKDAGDKLAHTWNQFIDKTCGAAIASLSSKGW